jgi:hypothetical protein
MVFLFLEAGSLSGPDTMYEAYPELYPNGPSAGSMIPFELHLLRAELSHLQGQTALTIQALTGTI